MHIDRRGLVIACLLTLCASVRAASFSTLCPDAEVRECHIIISGPIEAGDAERLQLQLRKPPKPDNIYRRLFLDSPGGDLNEAVGIARILREALLETTNTLMWMDPVTQNLVSRNGTCASACFLIWAAGTHRVHSTKDGRGIGLHRPYFERSAYDSNPAAIADAHNAVDSIVSTFLRRERIPDRLVDEMLARSSREIYWLSSREDGLPLWGRASWFEEMLIARCNFDPARDLRLHAAAMQESEMLGSQAGPDRRPSLAALNKWQSQQDQCEQEVRRAAQSALRR